MVDYPGLRNAREISMSRNPGSASCAFQHDAAIGLPALGVSSFQLVPVLHPSIELPSFREPSFYLRASDAGEMPVADELADRAPARVSDPRQASPPGRRFHRRAPC